MMDEPVMFNITEEGGKFELHLNLKIIFLKFEMLWPLFWALKIQYSLVHSYTKN